MSLNETQQIFEAWKRADSILVAFRHDPHHDGAASALALASVLKKMGKPVVIVCDNWLSPNELQFLPETSAIKPKLEQIQKFVIEVDVAQTPIKELSYDVKDNKLRISLVPKTGAWQSEHVTTKPADYRFDLICTIGTPDLESLGKLFETHPDFFYHTPIINFDHDPANEHYGQINHIDINATAVCELLFDLINKIDRHLIDEPVATCLLTGMIGKTKSFKTPNVTPKTLSIASELVALGAKREVIVHHLYRTRTVPVLRLWGRALARLKHDASTKLVWTVLSRQDFIHAGADATVLPAVIDELIINAPEARVALILHEDAEQEKQITGLLHTERPFSATDLGAALNGTGDKETFRFTVPDKTLIEAEPYVTNLVKQQIAKTKVT